MDVSDPKIIAAIISAIVSLFMFVAASLVKPFWERHFHSFKLRADHQYEQRKKIKEAISKYKVRLLDSAESLNHRLWNFSDNCKNGWHIRTNGADLNGMYYLQSFCYRFLSFFAWCRKIEKEMVYLDSTISEKDDLEFIKYLKLFPQMFCDTTLFEGHNYDNFYAKDHFFKDDFLYMIDSMITNDGVMAFSKFKELKDISDYEKVVSYIGGISRDRSCLRWYVMHSFHFMLMAFLTKFGYDFQKTSEAKLRALANKSPKNVLLVNISKILNRNHLEQASEVKTVIKVLERV